VQLLSESPAAAFLLAGSAHVILAVRCYSQSDHALAMALAQCGARTLPSQLSSLTRLPQCGAASRFLSTYCLPSSPIWPSSSCSTSSRLTRSSSIANDSIQSSCKIDFGSRHCFRKLSTDSRVSFSLRASTTEVLSEVAEEAQASTSSGETYRGREKIKDIRGDDEGVSNVGKQLVIRGWVRTVRAQKAFAFMQVRCISFYGE
jgi:hypothetical protein